MDTLSDPEKRAKFNVPAFVMGKNSKDHRWPEIEACAKSLKGELGFKKLGAVGYCYGGWAVFQLGKKSRRTTHSSRLPECEKLVDSIRQPSGGLHLHRSSLAIDKGRD